MFICHLYHVVLSVYIQKQWSLKVWEHQSRYFYIYSNILGDLLQKNPPSTFYIFTLAYHFQLHDNIKYFQRLSTSNDQDSCYGVETLMGLQRHKMCTRLKNRNPVWAGHVVLHWNFRWFMISRPEKKFLWLIHIKYGLSRFTLHWFVLTYGIFQYGQGGKSNRVVFWTDSKVKTFDLRTDHL